MSERVPISITFSKIQIDVEHNYQLLPLTADVEVQCNSVETGGKSAVCICEGDGSEPHFRLLPVSSQNHHFIRLVQLIKSR